MIIAITMLIYVNMFWLKSTPPSTGISPSRGILMFFSAADTFSGSFRFPVSEAVIICSPMKFERPVPKMVRVRPVTFWFAIMVMVRNA